jgi:hypothetical protein
LEQKIDAGQQDSNLRQVLEISLGGSDRKACPPADAQPKQGCDSDIGAELADYIADHYGACTIAPCRCLRTLWLGRSCIHWRPVAARTWDELRSLQERYGAIEQREEVR